MSVYVDLWRVTAFDLAGRPMYVARRVFTRYAADAIAERWMMRADVGRVELASDEPAPQRARSYR
jgi:hypothetical protein